MRIDFAAGKIFTQRGDQCGERLIRLADDVGQAEDRHGGTLRGEVVLEVVMSAQFAGEERIGFAHLLLDEGMADAAHHRLAACGLDDLLDDPTAAQVIVDRALAGGEHILGDERGDEVHGDDLALLIDEAGAVGIAIIRDAKGIRTGAHLGLQICEGGMVERVGLVIREASIGIFEETVPGDQALERPDLPDAHAVGEVDGEVDGTGQVGELRHMLGVGRVHVRG